MKYVVTGAAGFIGSQLAEALVADGHEVAGVDCFTDYYDVGEKERNADGLDLRRLDLADEPLDLAGVDGVFHLAGQPGVRSFGEAYPTPEDAQPQPLSPYGVTKLACEHLAHAYTRSFSLDAVVLRYFTVYGPRQRPDMFFRRVCERLLDGGTFEIFGSGGQSRSFTYVDDVVDATRAAMERAPAGATYNVGGGEEATMLEAIALLEDVSGRSLAVRRTAVARGDMPRTSADISRIREQLSWEPRTSLRDGLQTEWSWCSARVAAG